MDIKFQPAEITRKLVRVIAIIASAHFLGMFSSYVLGRDHVMGLVPLFDFEGEANVPAFYSAAVILFCSFLLAVIAAATQQKGRPYRHWAVLSFIFLFLAADELIQIHENLIVLTKAFKTSGLLYHAWVVPYFIGAAIIALAFRKFILNLPPHIRRLVFIAGATFIVGAIGCEMIGGWYRDTYGWSAVAAFISTAEELLEMAGMVIFAHALLTYLQENFTLRVSPLENLENKDICREEVAKLLV